MKSLPILIGENVWLGRFPETNEFYEKYLSWLHHPEVKPYIEPLSLNTHEQIRDFLHENILNKNIKHWCTYFGKYPENVNPVGDTSLEILKLKNEFSDCDKDFKNFRKVEEFKVLVGENIRGKGLGKEMTKLTLNYAFSSSKDNAVYLGVFLNNPAVHLYRKVGFKELEEIKDKNTGKQELIMRITYDEWCSFNLK